MMKLMCYNDDVLVEILVRLPAKSLIRFKSVCRHLLRLISSNQLCHLHTLRRHKPQPSLILHAHSSNLFFYFHPISNAPKLVPYSFNDIPYPKILSSCNGLFLLQSGYHLKDSCYVYNPTTKQSREISLIISEKYIDVLGLNLAFDPSVSPHYKIVCVKAVRMSSSDHRRRSCQIEVYDSESCEWKICVESLTGTTNANVNFSTGVHWSNVIHWGSSRTHHPYFNMNKSNLGFLPDAIIPWYGDFTKSDHLQESNGRLYQFVINAYCGDKSVAVYELQQDYSKWSFKYNHVFDQHPQENVHILRFMAGDDGDTDVLVTHAPGKISAYRFLDNTGEEVIDLTNQPFYQQGELQFDLTRVHHFGETLALV